MKDKIQLFVLMIRSVDCEIQIFQPKLHSVAEIEAVLWQEVEEALEAELAIELNEAMTDVELTAEAPAQESGVESKNQEAAEVVEIKLSTYNLKKAGQYHPREQRYQT